MTSPREGMRRGPRIRSAGKLREESIPRRGERVTGVKCCQRSSKVRSCKGPFSFATRRPLVSSVGAC